MNAKIRFSEFFVQKDTESNCFYNQQLENLTEEEKWFVKKIIFFFDSVNIKISSFTNPGTKFEEVENVYSKRKQKITDSVNQILRCRVLSS